jgi:putative heme-binding domain-containing protein
VHWMDRLDDAPSYFKAAVADAHPRVRLEGVRALALVPRPESAELAATVLDQPMDRFLDFALWQAMRDLAPVWVPAVKDGSLDFGGRVEHLTFALKAVDSPAVVEPLLNLIKQDKIPADRVDSVLTLVATLGGPKELGAIWEMVVASDASATPGRQAALLTALVNTSELRKIQPAGDLSRVASLLQSKDPQVQAAAVRAAGVWKVAALRGDLERISTSGSATPSEVRFAAIDALAALGGADGKASLLRIAERRSPLADSELAIAALVAIDPALAARLTAELLSAAPEGVDPSSTVGALVAQKQGSTALAAALGKAQVPTDTAKLALRVARSAPQPSEALIQAIQKAGGLESAVWKLTPQLMDELVAEVRSKGDAARGEAIYRRADMQCLKCHAIGGSGGQVGPDFVSLGASAQVDYIIESLIEPAKKVKENYHSQLVLTDESVIVTGIVARETEQELVLRDQNDRLITIAKDSIEERKDGRSLMPDGLMDPLTRSELVDLTRFLSELGKVGDYSIGQSRAVRRWQVLTWSKEAHQRLNRTSYDTAATDDPALVWDSAYSRVRGDLPLDGLPTYVVHQGNAPTTFLRFEIDVSSAGKVKLASNNADGLTMWLDGKPMAIAKETVVDLATGKHTVTLAVDRTARTEPLRVELAEVDGSPAKAQLVGGK